MKKEKFLEIVNSINDNDINEKKMNDIINESTNRTKSMLENKLDDKGYTKLTPEDVIGISSEMANAQIEIYNQRILTILEKLLVDDNED